MDDDLYQKIIIQVQTAIANHESDIATLKAQVEVLQEKNVKLETEITTLKNEITNLKSELLPPPSFKITSNKTFNFALITSGMDIKSQEK